MDTCAGRKFHLPEPPLADTAGSLQPVELSGYQKTRKPLLVEQCLLALGDSSFSRLLHLWLAARPQTASHSPTATSLATRPRPEDRALGEFRKSSRINHGLTRARL